MLYTDEQREILDIMENRMEVLLGRAHKWEEEENPQIASEFRIASAEILYVSNLIRKAMRNRNEAKS